MTAPQLPYPVEHLDRVDSTNTEAMRRIAQGEHGPLWVLAREQTSGKGRAGRSWTSEPGNFYGSLILPLDCPRSVASQLSLIVGVAVVDALNDVAGGPIPGLRLKWPNDVLVGTAKLAGILPEATTARGTGQLLAVLGIGINLTNPPAQLGRPVASLNVHTRSLAPTALVAPISHWLQHGLRLWNRGENFSAVKDAWQDRAGRHDEAITVNTGQGPVAGTYQGLDDDGALLMRLTDGSARRVTFGDVMLAGEQPADPT
jgi:BirA family transcriptional regulator, biotin operon repressor / biotin---[acetyl-CoA-carboxylase] ligase